MAETLMACPICGETAVELFAKAYDKEYFTSDEEYRYALCPSCSAVYLDSPPADRLDEIYPTNYYSYGGIGESTTFTERIKERLDGRMLAKVLKSIPGEKLRVLDVGGGSGWLLSTVRKVDRRVVETHEVDLQAAAAPPAEAAGHVYHCMPIEEFTSDEPFDLILMMSIIEHVPDPRKVMAGMAGLLSENGVLLMKTPNTATVDARIFRHRNWGGLHCPRHFVLFTEPGLDRLGSQVGLAKSDSYYTQGAPQWAISVMAWLSDRGWIKVTPQKPAYMNWVYEPLTAFFAGVDFLRARFAPTAQMMISFKRAR
ncbi:class I SAM-dependent methyltransferase [Streptomyces sp. NBC_00879]|uniref:class I SAM-dependent methyltransferase n=1 Tax=Streptomyces sp. NBC_00879 TaxID=2975855 RepID=UPI003866DC2A|nr:class I SAM-dependent methyltransferase [Streptomyces sp. NBC_00879]